ncbi:MAG: acireductone synthase [Cyanobacteriota bacterium]|nr:acireductone synthase [Cyanobacteriota bacterium]
MKISPDIQYVLLDIEGTTCPISFVSTVLFPYASAQLLSYLKKHQHEESIRALLAEVFSAWRDDNSPEAMSLRQESMGQGDQPDQHDLLVLSPEEACIYLNWLTKQDKKLTALKELQGLIWEEGYQQAKLVAPLFADVPAALKLWHAKGITLSVYSSGSVQAQKLLYRYTNAGDLSQLFSHWFDTRTGAKNQPSSYQTIAMALKAKPEHVLFISDSPAELIAANNAQMKVIFSLRPGNQHRAAKDFPIIENFDDLEF